MMAQLEIKISNISFVQEETEQKVQLRFNSTNGQINISGYVSVSQAEFFANSSSTEAMVELVRGELVELVNAPPAA